MRTPDGTLLRGAQGAIASLGQVMQLAYVPADFDAALKFWTATMGAGPFFMLEHVKIADLKYRGAPSDVDFSMALGHWGDMQIELIHQHNDAPSIYSTWRKAGREGLHHMCVLVDDMRHGRQVCADAGATVLQEGTLRGGGVEAIFVDTGGGPGTMVEILKQDAAGLAFFQHIRDAARNWDGRDPVRRPG